MELVYNGPTSTGRRSGTLFGCNASIRTPLSMGILLVENVMYFVQSLALSRRLAGCSSRTIFLFVLDVVGYAETTMAQVLGTNEQMVTLPLSHPKTGNRPRGTVSIRMDELEHQHDLVTLKLRALQARQVLVFIYPGRHFFNKRATV